MKEFYEVLFYSGDEPLFPAYYIVHEFESDKMEDELKNALGGIIQRVRKTFSIDEDVSDQKIYKKLYVLKEDALISARELPQVFYEDSYSL